MLENLLISPYFIIHLTLDWFHMLNYVQCLLPLTFKMTQVGKDRSHHKTNSLKISRRDL